MSPNAQVVRTAVVLILPLIAIHIVKPKFRADRGRAVLWRFDHCAAAGLQRAEDGVARDGLLQRI